MDSTDRQRSQAIDTDSKQEQHSEPHSENLGDRLNWLRAGVLGANDGIVSTASIVLGVAGATPAPSAVLTAGLAGLFAGAMSMAAGEYVSVSSQRDAERALLAEERTELADDPDAELAELADYYAEKGLSPGLAKQVAEQLSERDALQAHAETELGIPDTEQLVNPWQAALSSFLAFSIGALFPLLAAVLVSGTARVPVTGAVVVLALIVTGTVSSRLGHAPRLRATVRNVLGGLLAMAVTYGIGTLVGQTLV